MPACSPAAATSAGSGAAALGSAERFHRVMEQAHQAADVFRPDDIPPLASFSGAR